MSEPLSDEYLDALRKLCDAATPGPWGLYCHHWVSTPENGFCVYTGENSFNDAAFIAAARNAVPALLAEVVRLRRYVSEPQEMFAEIPSGLPRRIWRR